MRRGAAEAIEAIAKESPSGKDSCIGKELGQIELPEGVTIGALIRDKKGKIAHDHVPVSYTHLTLPTTSFV